MTRRAFRQADLTRALRAAQAAGGKFAVVLHPRTGLIEIKPGDLTGMVSEESSIDEVNSDLEDLAKRNGYG